MTHDTASPRESNQALAAPARARAPVSVVIPCYRNRDTIARAVLSVVEQTLPPTEIVIVDDGSTDETVDVLRELQRTIGKDWVHIIALERNMGQSHARNVGWDAATQPYVALLDADDSWHPRKLELQYAWMEAHPEVMLTGHLDTDADRINSTVSTPDSATEVRARRVSRWQQLSSNQLSTRTVMIRRDIPYRFESSRRNGEDLLLFSKIVLSGLDTWVIEAVLAYRYKPDWGASGVSGALWKQERGELQVLRLLHRDGHMGMPALAYTVTLSLAKYLRRCLVFAGRSVDQRVRSVVPSHESNGRSR